MERLEGWQGIASMRLSNLTEDFIMRRLTLCKRLILWITLGVQQCHTTTARAEESLHVPGGPAAVTPSGKAVQAGETPAIDLDADGRADALCGEVLQGARHFTDPIPGGNGRSCATCHVPSEHFTLTPEYVEQRYQAWQADRGVDPDADDPLFRSIDADDGAEDYTMLRTRALIRVRVPLPPWVRLKSDPDATHVTVLRGVPSVRNLRDTAPYQIDGRIPDLERQALAALGDHHQITFEPAPEFLREMAEFQRALFTSPGMRRHSAALGAGLPAPDPDPPLDALEQRGKERFTFLCAGCHGGPTQSVSSDKRWFAPFDGTNIGTFVSNSTSNPPAGGPEFPTSPIHSTDRQLPVQAFIVTDTDGVEHEVSSSDPGAVLHHRESATLNKGFLVVNRFEPPQLRGIRYTAPYFHANNALSLREVLQHYQSLFTFVSAVRGFPVPLLSDEDIEPLLAYLQKL